MLTEATLVAGLPERAAAGAGGVLGPADRSVRGMSEVLL